MFKYAVKYVMYVDESIGFEKMLALSMDGPNVNWAVYRELSADIENRYGKKLLNIGSCGLHTVHNAFKAGVQDLKVDRVLKSVHTLLYDTPARREEFVKYAYSDNDDVKFPLPFCSHRWLENVSVCDRAMHMYIPISKYVKSVVEKKSKNPKTQSFETVSTWVQDKLALVKMHVFNYIACPMEKFLTLYQTDRPMVMFITEDLEEMIRTLMVRYVKPEVMKGANTPLKLMKVSHADVGQQVSGRSVDLGFAAQRELVELKKRKSVSEGEYLQFKLMCRDAYVTIVTRLLDKSPITCSLMRGLRCLDPVRIAKYEMSALFRGVLNHLVDAGRLSLSDCDTALSQYKQFNMDSGLEQLMLNFDKKNDRADGFYDTMKDEDKYSKLWAVVEQLLLLSHGNAQVERGFSVNKDVSTENLSEHRKLE